MAGRYRRPTTPEQREKAAEARDAKLSALHDTLAEQVSELANGPQWRAWLDTAAKFHNYSFNNTLLILAQKPEATQVAGYTLWQQLGRQVDKGQRGISIIAPVTRKVDAEQTDSPAVVQHPAGERSQVESGESARSARHVVAFRPAYVWDVSQTSGDPLPDRPRPELLAGQAPEGLWESLAKQCEAAGFTVDRRAIEGAANGYTDFKSHEVVVRADVEPAQAVKTLAHELGHVLMHDPASFTEGQTRTCRGAGEVEAESMAYLVAADHGLDTSSYTFTYVAAWAASTGDVDAAVRDSGARVLKTAHQVLDQIERDLTGDIDQTPAAAASTSTTVVDELAVRADAGADRTAAIRQAVEKPAQDPEQTFSQRDRLLAANDAAAAFFTDRFASAGSWAPAYLAERIGTAELPGRGIGYAPAGWTNLTDHLHRGGFTDAEIVGAGLGMFASTGRVVDRFRDRLMFPITDRTDDGTEIAGFVGRRNPAEDAAADSRTPKYLNTPQTALYTKGEHLYGLAENAGTLDRGGLAVVVEGPLDALAVDVASRGMMAGVALAGTAFTTAQASQLAAALPAESDRVVVATDADPAGQAAASRAYAALTAQRLDPRGAVLPAGMDPAQTAQQHGPAALVDRLATAEPMGRQLVDHALAGQDLAFVEGRVRAARQAAGIITQAMPTTWQREIRAVVDRTDVEEYLLRDAVVDRIGTDTHAMGRLSGRDRRDDLDRGQHVQATPAQLAAMSAGRTGPVRPMHSRPTETARPVHATAGQAGARYGRK